MTAAKPPSPPAGLARRVADESPQGTLFDVSPSWRDLWRGMPHFEQRDARPAHTITVNFMSYDDVREFARRLALTVTSATDSVWFPPDVVDAPSEWEYSDEP